jgi:hypothetical protein
MGAMVTTFLSLPQIEGMAFRQTRSAPMPQLERFEILMLGSGKSGKSLAWHMAQSGRRAAVVKHRWIGGS